MDQRAAYKSITRITLVFSTTTGHIYMSRFERVLLNLMYAAPFNPIEQAAITCFAVQEQDVQMLAHWNLAPPGNEALRSRAFQIF